MRRLRLMEPYRAGAVSDVLCRRHRGARSIPPSVARDRPHPRARLISAAARTACAVRRLEHSALLIQNAFESLFPALQRVAVSADPVRTGCAAGTCFEPPADPPRHGMGLWPSLLLAPADPQARQHSLREDACPLSLQPTSCQRAPTGPPSRRRASGLRLSDRRDLPPPPNLALGQALRRLACRDGADSPLPVHRPRVAVRLAPHRPPQPAGFAVELPPKQQPIRVCLFSSREPKRASHRHPCRARRRGVVPAPRRTPRPPFTRRANAALRGAQGAFHRPVPRFRCANAPQSFGQDTIIRSQ